MRHIQRQSEIQPRYISIGDLRTLLSVGKTTAEKIGADSGAKVKIGKRSLYNIDKVMAYMESLEE